MVLRWLIPRVLSFMEVLVQARHMLPSWLFCLLYAMVWRSYLLLFLVSMHPILVALICTVYSAGHHRNTSWHRKKTALLALNRIMRKPLLHHIILALNALFIDKLWTLSNQQLAVLDIMFWKYCNSPLPFGGLLILESLDPRQIGIIKAMLLLTSTIILTCFQAVKLCHLVMAFHNPEYQELLNIMQTNPIDLIHNKEKKQDSMNWSTCFGASRHGTTPPSHPTWLGFLQRRFQWQHLSKIAPIQLLLDLLLTILRISYAFLVIVREAPVPSASICQPVLKPKRPSTKTLGSQRSLFFTNMVFMNVPWMIHWDNITSPV